MVSQEGSKLDIKLLQATLLKTENDIKVKNNWKHFEALESNKSYFDGIN